jgi:hypothetical protein
MYELLLAKQDKQSPMKAEERLSTGSKSMGYKFVNTIVRNSDLNVRSSALKDEPVHQEDEAANIIIKHRINYDRLGSVDLNESYYSRASCRSRRSRAQRS